MAVDYDTRYWILKHCASSSHARAWVALQTFKRTGLESDYDIAARRAKVAHMFGSLRLWTVVGQGSQRGEEHSWARTEPLGVNVEHWFVRSPRSRATLVAAECHGRAYRVSYDGNGCHSLIAAGGE